MQVVLRTVFPALYPVRYLYGNRSQAPPIAPRPPGPAHAQYSMRTLALTSVSAVQRTSESISLEFDTADGTTHTVEVSDDAVARDERRVEPPLRRWAAARALRNDPGQLEDLLERADGMPPRHRDTLLHGLLDAADGLERPRGAGW